MRCKDGTGLRPAAVLGVIFQVTDYCSFKYRAIDKRLLEQRAKGKAIILISTELEEVLSLSDRVAVLYRGEIIGEMKAGEIDMGSLGLLMLGKKPSDELESANN